MVAYSFLNLTKIPDLVLQQTSLEKLDLRHNKLTNISGKLDNLKLLRSLNLGYNQITELPDIFEWLRI